MGKVIGIDLGTTNSCVAVLENGTPVIIPNAEGGRTTPSVVAFTKKGERLVGESARRQAAVNADHTVSSIKREMGSDYRVSIDGNRYSPQEISAMILRKLKKDAENFLGEPVSEAVITVPAYFSDAQRQATKDAGRIAGLKVLRIINEPTSAALAYGLDHGSAQKILVYDLGGGTFDVSVIEIGENLIEVLATSGDNHLGGDDFDGRVVDYLLRTFREQEKIDLSKDPAAMQRLREAAEKAKMELSTMVETNINLPFIAVDRKGEGKHLDIMLTRAKFEEMTADLVNRTSVPVQNAMSDAGLSMNELDKVLLVGGSTRIPAVQRLVKQLTGKEPAKSLNPDECVALGASIQGGKLASEPGSIIPGSAASELILMDVTPLSLSIETVGGVCTKVLDRNSTIPTRKSKIFSTAANFQTNVEIKVYQGERQFARDNKLIGNFRLNGIKRAMAGVPQIEVTFDMDVNGILKVSAKDLGTGKQQEITITSSSNLSEAEIEQAIRNAQEYEAKDAKGYGNFETYTEAGRVLTLAQNAMADREKKKTLSRDQKSDIKKKMKELQKQLSRIKPDNISDEQAENLRIAKEALEQSAGDLLQNDK